MGGHGKRPSSPWSDLPPDLGGLILGTLLCYIDRLHFKAVSRQWRLAAQQQPPALPLLWGHESFKAIPGGEQLRFTVPTDLGRSLDRCLGCFDGWLLYHELPNNNLLKSHRYFLINPTSGATITDIPRDFDYGTSIAASPSMMRKIVVCSPDLAAAIIEHDSSVAFFRPGAASWSACAPEFWNRGWYMDIALYRGRLYALNHQEHLFVHELGGGGGRDAVELPKLASRAVQLVVKAHQPASLDDPIWRYLVVSCGKLLMVKWSFPDRRHRTHCSSGKGAAVDLAEGIKLKVFEADLEMGRWLEVKDLNGQALFVGRGGSKALPLSGTDQMFQANRIYFLGRDLAGCGIRLTPDDFPTFGFYDLSSDTVGKGLPDEMGNEVGSIWRRRWREWFFPCESRNNQMDGVQSSGDGSIA